jgi:hypothetical protein
VAPKKHTPKRSPRAPAKTEKTPPSPKKEIELTPQETEFQAKLRLCTPRERLFIRYKLEKKNNTEAARLAGYSEQTAHVQGSQVLKRLRVWEAYLAGLDANGFGAHDIRGDIQDLRTFDRSEIEREIQVPAEEYVSRRVADLLPLVQRKLDALRAYVNSQEAVDEATLKLQGERLLTLQKEAMEYVELLAVNPDATRVTLETVMVTKRVLCYELAKQKGLTRYIKSVKPTKYGDVIEVYDWLDGVEMGAKVLGMFKERHEVTGENGAPLTAATVVVLPSNGRDGGAQ